MVLRFLRPFTFDPIGAISIYTLSDLGNSSIFDWLAISDYDVIFTVQGGGYKAEQNRCRELGVLQKFHRKAFLKINEYPSAGDFEGKKRLHGV